MIELRPIPRSVEDALLGTVLKAGPLLPVNTSRWSWVDLHNAYHNADEHLLLYAIIDKELATPEVQEALARLQRVCVKLRQDVMKLLVWTKLPLAESVADKYRNSIAENYSAMVEAGGVLVGAVVPQHVGVELYRSLCTG